VAVTNDDLERVRNHLETKINSVSVEHVHLVQAIASYSERFTAVDARFDAVDHRLDALSADMDRRFESATADMNRRFDDVRSDINRLDGRIDRLDTNLNARIDRLDTKLDARFNLQTAMMAALGIIVLFGDSIRAILGG